MFKATLINLTPDARTAAVDLGMSKLENLTAQELAALLEAFRALDPVQNIADPEIRLQTVRESYFIRTERGKLFLYNARYRADPASELTVAEIIAELDGSAAAARTAVPFALSAGLGDGAAGAAVTSVTPEPPRKPPVFRSVLALVLLGAVIYTKYLLDWTAALPPLRRIDSAELATLRSSLAGVYLTGSQPGQHGIVLLENGDLKLFQLNAQAAPSVLYDTYAPGRLGAGLWLAINQPGERIEVTDHDTLVYCGETYRRIP